MLQRVRMMTRTHSDECGCLLRVGNSEFKASPAVAESEADILQPRLMKGELAALPVLSLARCGQQSRKMALWNRYFLGGYLSRSLVTALFANSRDLFFFSISRFCFTEPDHTTVFLARSMMVSMNVPSVT